MLEAVNAVLKYCIGISPEIVCALIDGEATLKRFYKKDGVVTLKAENDKYAPIVVLHADDTAIRVRVIGDLPVHGRYKVTWQVVAQDGDEQEDSYKFTYQGPLPEASPAPACSFPPRLASLLRQASHPAPHRIGRRTTVVS